MSATPQQQQSVSLDVVDSSASLYDDQPPLLRDGVVVWLQYAAACLPSAHECLTRLEAAVAQARSDALLVTRGGSSSDKSGSNSGSSDADKKGNASSSTTTTMRHVYSPLHRPPVVTAREVSAYLRALSLADARALRDEAVALATRKRRGSRHSSNSSNSVDNDDDGDGDDAETTGRHDDHRGKQPTQQPHVAHVTPPPPPPPQQQRTSTRAGNASPARRVVPFSMLTWHLPWNVPPLSTAAAAVTAAGSTSPSRSPHDRGTHTPCNAVVIDDDVAVCATTNSTTADAAPVATASVSAATVTTPTPSMTTATPAITATSSCTVELEYTDTASLRAILGDEAPAYDKSCRHHTANMFASASSASAAAAADDTTSTTATAEATTPRHDRNATVAAARDTTTTTTTVRAAKDEGVERCIRAQVRDILLCNKVCHEQQHAMTSSHDALHTCNGCVAATRSATELLPCCTHTLQQLLTLVQEAATLLSDAHAALGSTMTTAAAHAATDAAAAAAVVPAATSLCDARVHRADATVKHGHAALTSHRNGLVCPREPLAAILPVPRYRATCSAVGCQAPLYVKRCAPCVCRRCGQLYCEACCHDLGIGPYVYDGAGERVSLGWERLCAACHEVCARYVAEVAVPFFTAGGVTTTTMTSSTEAAAAAEAVPLATLKDAVLCGYGDAHGVSLSDGRLPFYVLTPLVRDATLPLSDSMSHSLLVCNRKVKEGAAVACSLVATATQATSAYAVTLAQRSMQYTVNRYRQGRITAAGAATTPTSDAVDVTSPSPPHDDDGAARASPATSSDAA